MAKNVSHSFYALLDVALSIKMLFWALQEKAKYMIGASLWNSVNSKKKKKLE